MPEITESNIQPIPKGTYVLQFTGREQKTLPLGDAWEWSFEVKSVVFAQDPNDDLDDDDEPLKTPEQFVGETIKDITSLFLSPNAKATKWVMALLGMRELPRDDQGKVYFSFDWEDVDLRYVTATIGHKDNGWPKILELAPYKPKGKKQQVVQAAEDDDEPGLITAGSTRKAGASDLF